ncbi:putative eka-like protein [Erysiphe necator]|uniref:Putative eka-like protein n=1 Tax=Uncinula necator TaxID=52586 RepID=A0A0B1PAP4_UNCNE|nr:putative eka-like protein [Erysiphe necator]
MSNAKLEPASNWLSLLIPTVSSCILKEQGLTEVSKEMLSDEIERASTMRSMTLKLFGKNNPDAPHRTWMAYISKAPRSDFMVFDESGKVRPFKKPQAIDFYKRCNGHHSPKNCSRAPSCGNCGSTIHPEDICMALTKFRNCEGPHRSDTYKYLARPTHSGPLTKKQLKVFRKAGDREYQAIFRAKLAEDRADEIKERVETPHIDQTESTKIERMLASPVVVSTEDAIRL